MAGESLVSDVEVVAPHFPSVSGLSSLSNQVLLTLQQLGDDGYDGQEGAAD